MARRVRAQPWPGRLPAEVTTFVDRRFEVAQVKRLLMKARLVTLTGVGGTGKTRLAVRVAADLRRGYADGVWHVNLAEVVDGSVLDYAVAQALGVHDDNDLPPRRLLADRLAEREMLVVLDDCEHLVDACAALIDTLLRAAPRLRFLCTSRQPFGVVGETVWTVPPLPVPAGDATGESPAIELFVDRAAAVAPGFMLSDDNRHAVADICDRLDGLPLAIELAAAQLRTLSLGQLADGLADRFRLLATRHATPARHRGLQETFDWSYALCSPAERALWSRLAVFAGSFDLEAVTEVCADADVPAETMLDVLAGLVDKSVAVREDVDGHVRYRLLETVRAYGLDRLGALDGAPAALWGRVRDWYVRLAVRFDAEWFGPDQRAWAARLRAEMPNLRAVLSRCLHTPGDGSHAMRLAGALRFYWIACGAISEGRHWLDRVLAAAADDPTRERVWAESAHSWVLIAQPDLPRADASTRRCLELARALDVPLLVATATIDRALYTMLADDDTVTARLLLEEALTWFAADGDDPGSVALARVSLAALLLRQGDLDGAQLMCAQLRAFCERSGDRWMGSYALQISTWTALAAGESARAVEHARECLRLHHALGDTFGLTDAFHLVALALGTDDDHVGFARAMGAGDALSPTSGPRITGPALIGHNIREMTTRSRQALGDGPFEAAYRYGRHLPVDDAVTDALGAAAPSTVAVPAQRAPSHPLRRHADDPAPVGARQNGWPPAGPHPAAVRPPSAISSAAPESDATGRSRGVVPDLGPLTPRESEVAVLITEGLSNKQIAARLVTSRRTAESHVENILRKLGFTSRTQVAAWVAQRRH